MKKNSKQTKIAGAAKAARTKLSSSATYHAGPYKGYFGRAEWDADESAFHGEVIGTRDVITFAGRTVGELNKAFCESIEEYLEMCKRHGNEPDKPFSGTFLVRVSQELHKRISSLAESKGESLNAWIAGVLESATG